MSIFVETIFTDGLAHLSYLVGDESQHVAAVIDPRRDCDVYLELARKRNVVITHVLETHIHADFVSGTVDLVRRCGTAQAFLSSEGKAKYGFKHEPLRNGDIIELGKLQLTALHTPGHTPEHMAYQATEQKHPGTPFAVFTGDCLFADSVGRPDLLGEDQARSLARQLFHSLHTVLLGLGDEVLVHPAHGAGSPCGAEIGDRLVTSIGHERTHNEALQIKDEAEFIEFVLHSSPPEPRYYQRMKKTNANGPAPLDGLPLCRPLPPKEFQATAAKQKTRLIDNRDMLAFGGGHIAKAINIGPKPMLSIWAGWLLNEQDHVLLVLGEASRLDDLLRQFIRVGIDNFAGFLVGGMDGWTSSGLPLENLRQITVDQLQDRIAAGDVLPLDVRSPKEWEKGHVPGARYRFLPELEEKMKTLPRDKPIAVYCASGYRASIGASLLLANGVTDVLNVPGSWEAWEAQALPIETPSEDKAASDTDR